MVAYSYLMKINTADWLRKKIEEAGITQAELSRLSGISPTYLSNKSFLVAKFIGCLLSSFYPPDTE